MSGPEERLAASEPVRAVRQALAGIAGERWLVGGAIRDALLGRDVRDVDLAGDTDPEPAARAVADAVGGMAFPLSERFGAWRAISADRSWVCDVAALQGPTIEADLARRDFTINAMAMPLAGGDLLDPHGGRADLDAGMLRVVAATAYEDDPLRPLRLVRLATELGLAPEPATARMTQGAAARVTDASSERVWAELRRIVIADRVLDGLDLAGELGLTAAVLPELEELRGVEQNQYHHLDVYDHTMAVVAEQIGLESRLTELFGETAGRIEAQLRAPLADELTRGQALRFGALLHDIAKPPTRGVTAGGRITFIGHDSVGAEMIQSICRRLHTSTKLASFVAALAQHHLILGFLVHQRPLPREVVYAYLSRTDPVEIEVTLLTCADRLATRGRNAEPAIAAHLELAAELMADALDWRERGRPAPLVRGDELAAELGIEPGPELGRLLEELARARYVGEVETRSEAVELARRVLENTRGDR